MNKMVILDTNFLLIPYQFKIDIFSELSYLIEDAYDLIVPTGVNAEIEKIAKSKGRHALGGRLALKILAINKDKVKFVKSDGLVDDWNLKFANDKRAIICTNDKKLRLLSKKAKLRTITMKSKAKIGFA